MKKILLTLIGTAAGAALVHAQGFINMQNLSADIQVSTNTSYATGYPTLVGGSTKAPATSSGTEFYFAVLAATSTTANDLGNPNGSDWFVVENASDVAAVANSTSSGGAVLGPGGSSGFATGNLPQSGSTVYDVMVVGWSGNLGTTWAAVSADFADNFAGITSGWAGYSNVGTVTPTTATPGASIFGGSAAIDGDTILYNLTPTPEPTTLALAGLGGLSMLLFRRRK